MTGPWIIAFCLLSVAVLTLAFIVIGLLNRFGPVLDKMQSIGADLASISPDQGLQRGRRVPSFHVVDQAGQSVSSAELWAEGPTLCLLLSPGCEPCADIAEQLRNTVWPYPAVRPIAIVPDTPEGRRIDCGVLVANYYQGSAMPASAALGSNLSPHAFLISAKGEVLDRGVGNSLHALSTMIEGSGLSTSFHQLSS